MSSVIPATSYTVEITHDEQNPSVTLHPESNHIKVGHTHTSFERLTEYPINGEKIGNQLRKVEKCINGFITMQHITPAVQRVIDQQVKNDELLFKLLAEKAFKNS